MPKTIFWKVLTKIQICVYMSDMSNDFGDANLFLFLLGCWLNPHFNLYFSQIVFLMTLGEWFTLILNLPLIAYHVHRSSSSSSSSSCYVLLCLFSSVCPQMLFRYIHCSGIWIGLLCLVWIFFLSFVLTVGNESTKR